MDDGNEAVAGLVAPRVSAGDVVVVRSATTRHADNWAEGDRDAGHDAGYPDGGASLLRREGGAQQGEAEGAMAADLHEGGAPTRAFRSVKWR